MWFLGDWRLRSAHRSQSGKRVSRPKSSSRVCGMEILECRTLLSIGTAFLAANNPVPADDNVVAAAPAAYIAAAVPGQTATASPAGTATLSADVSGTATPATSTGISNTIHLAASWFTQQGPGP